MRAFERCISRLYPENERIKPADIWKLFCESREKHIQDLVHDFAPIMEMNENEPAKGFQDNDEIDLSLLTS